MFYLWGFALSVYQCIGERKPLANCKQEIEVSTLLSRTRISSVELQSETLISAATLLRFVQGRLFHIS